VTDSPAMALKWRKSTRSGPKEVSCVEVAFAGKNTAVRDSKSPETGILLFGVQGWSHFLDAARGGEFGPH